MRSRSLVQSWHRTVAIAAVIAAGAALVVVPGGTAIGRVEGQAARQAPSVVLIVVDDQAEGTLDAMPILRHRLLGRGVTMSNGIIPTSTCCPSRATLLTGQYARSSGVYNNVGSHGGWPTFYSSGSEEHTIAVALDEAGYRTAMLGKYMNGFALADRRYVPPGWDMFRATFDTMDDKPGLSAAAYYDYDLVGTGRTRHYGSRPRDYSTDVLGRAAVRFVESTPTDEPLFLYFAPTGAHSPFTPAPRHRGLWHNEPLNRAATRLTRNRPAFWPDRLFDRSSLKKLVRRQHEALMSVDEQIGQIMRALGPDRVANTLFVYLSDNGIQLGEHGLLNKYVPYSGATDVPMGLRWDGQIAAGSRDGRLMTNADLSATIADAANVRLTDPDGVSLMAARPSEQVVLEAVADKNHPAYCGIRTQRYTFVEYDDDQGSEMYDHATDPDELRNVAGRAGYADLVADLRSAAIEGCSPTPPGFDW